MKEKVNIENSNNITNSYKLIVLLFGTGLIVLAVIAFLEGIAFETKTSAIATDLTYKWKVRALLPELLIYSYFPASMNNATKLNSLRN